MENKDRIFLRLWFDKNNEPSCDRKCLFLVEDGSHLPYYDNGFFDNETKCFISDINGAQYDLHLIIKWLYID